MDHVAILRKARISKGDNLLADILSGIKTIESRWYVNKISPWDNLMVGDMVYFKESGCPVTAVANVSKVLQFSNLTEVSLIKIVHKYGKHIAPHSPLSEFEAWARRHLEKRYCILVFLKDVKKVGPFNIDKTGFGNSAAWLAVGDINRVMRKNPK